MIKAIYLILLQFLIHKITLQREILRMFKSEWEAKEKVRNLYIAYERIPWEKICLLILSILPPENFASKIFIYDKAIEWLPLNPANKEYIKFITKALYRLYKRRLIIRDEVDIDKIGLGEFKQFCDKNKKSLGKSITQRRQVVFRLPKEGEKVRLTICEEKMAGRILGKNSVKKMR